MAKTCPHCGAEHPDNQVRCPTTGKRVGDGTGLIGATISDRYHLVRLLGDGGMGAVYKAADRVLRRFVAIKLLHPDTAANEKSVERFQREARAAAAIGHPNIIDILDFGYTERTPYLVMEYLRGRSLAHAIATDGKMEIGRACRIGTHALAGLAAAHARGILHRDLKPANLMLIAHLGDRDFVKICDFGFAALLTPQERIAEEHRTLTPARTLVGTPAYAAPERLRGDDRPDPRIDVYSVGVLLFEMLAGQRPFDAPTFAKLAKMVRKEEPPSIRDFRRDCPHALERAVMRALAKDREDRWKDAETFAAALVPFGGRSVPDDADSWTDSFTMDLIKIRARETQRRRFDSIYGIPEGTASAGREDRTERQSAVSAVEAEAALAPRPAPVIVPTAIPSVPRRDPLAVTAPAIDAPPAAPLAETVVTEGVAQQPPAPAHAGHPPHRHRSRSDATERTSTAGVDVQGLLRPAAGARPLEEEVDTAIDGATRADQDGLGQEPVEDDGAPMALDGVLVVPLLRFIAREFGERSLKTVLDALPADILPVFESGIAPATWVPFDAVVNLVSVVDAKLGNDDLHFVLLCGRAMAEGAVELMRALRPPQGPSSEHLMVELPQIMASVTQGIDHRLAHFGRGYGRLEVREHGTPSLMGCVSMVGFLEHSLSCFGAEQVEVNLLTCRSLGDDQCLFDVSWLA